jgi:hypothetical protein
LQLFSAEAQHEESLEVKDQPVDITSGLCYSILRNNLNVNNTNMSTPEHANEGLDSAKEDFKRAFEQSMDLNEGFDVNVGGMMMHFKDKKEWVDFMEEANDPSNR